MSEVNSTAFINWMSRGESGGGEVADEGSICLMKERRLLRKLASI